MLNGQMLRGVTPPDARSSCSASPPGTARHLRRRSRRSIRRSSRSHSGQDPKRGDFATIAKDTGSRSASCSGTTARSARRRGNSRSGRPSDSLAVGRRSGLRRPGPVHRALWQFVVQLALGRRVTHVVRRGETLGGIAKRYGTSVSTLTRLNGLKRSVIFPGQTIVVRGSGSARRATSQKSIARSRGQQVQHREVIHQEVDCQEVVVDQEILRRSHDQEPAGSPHRSQRFEVGPDEARTKKPTT